MATASGRWWPLALCGALLLLAACSSYQPMDLPDARENPSFSGLFTGPEGEWVIDRKEP